MKDPWENLAFTWWPSSLGAHPGFPTVPAEAVGESWRVPWRTAVAPASWMPPTQLSPNLSQGGLLSSLDAGRSGGLFGRLATPPAHLESGRYWGIPPASPYTGAISSAADDRYLSPTPHTTDWERGSIARRHKACAPASGRAQPTAFERIRKRSQARAMEQQ
jgi:hypothetical protein